MQAHHTIICAVVGATLLAAAPALARSERSIPSAARRAMKQRVAIDLGFPASTIRLSQTQGTINLSRDLQSRFGTGRAYVMSASATVAPMLPDTKTSGKYLVAKSSQGRWEAFPLALVSGTTRRIATVSFGADQETYATADGRLGGTKVVQAVVAKGADSVYPSRGTLIASKPLSRGQLYFVLGAPNLDPRPATHAPSAVGAVDLAKAGPHDGSMGLSRVKTAFFEKTAPRP